MKKIFAIALIAFTVSSCSFVKDVQKHCKVDVRSGSIESVSFDACLKCDSLAKVVWTNIQKQKAKQ